MSQWAKYLHRKGRLLQRTDKNYCLAESLERSPLLQPQVAQSRLSFCLNTAVS